MGNEGDFDRARVLLPEGVTLTMFLHRWFGNVFIQMQKQPEQDGLCGKADGDLSDDDAIRANQIIAASRVTGGLLFDRWNPLLAAKREPWARSGPSPCTPSRPQDQELCRQKLASADTSISSLLLAGCASDVCFAGEWAADEAVAVAELIRQIRAAGGWYDSGGEQSCNEGCNAVGL